MTGPDEGDAPVDGEGPDGVAERIVLVGFMAAGKSTVGVLLAARLGRPFMDLDAEVERRAGRPVEEIFRQEGEDEFRRLEAEATRDLDDRSPVVVAAGGGWMARPELRDRWPEAVRVWLRVSPEEALRRIGDDVESRPMLDPSSPARSIRAIMERRRRDYARAELHVDTDDRSPGEVADAILDRLRGAPGDDGPGDDSPGDGEHADDEANENRSRSG